MDSSDDATILPTCPGCGMTVGAYHKPGCDMRRCRACGNDTGHPVWTGKHPDCLTRSDLVGYSVMVTFDSDDEDEPYGDQHPRHDELVAEIVTTLAPDRCTFKGVQDDGYAVTYTFFVEPCGSLPHPDYLFEIAKKYGYFFYQHTTHHKSIDKHSSKVFYIHDEDDDDRWPDS